MTDLNRNQMYPNCRHAYAEDGWCQICEAEAFGPQEQEEVKTMVIYLMHYKDAETIFPTQHRFEFSSLEELKEGLKKASIKDLRCWSRGYGVYGPIVGLEDLDFDFVEEGGYYLAGTTNYKATTKALS